MHSLRFHRSENIEEQQRTRRKTGREKRGEEEVRGRREGGGGERGKERANNKGEMILEENEEKRWGKKEEGESHTSLANALLLV